MKRLLLCLGTLITLALLLSSCHKHKPSGWIEGDEANCTTSGTLYKECTKCGEVITTAVVSPNGVHLEVEVGAVAPTCTADGLTAGTKCERCNIVMTPQETVPATGHTEIDGARVEPTCTAVGYEVCTKCSVCNEVLTGGAVIAALGHTSVDVPAKAPTCTEIGYGAAKKCSVCDEILEALDTVPATGHTEVAADPIQPTCVEIGYAKVTKCSVCDEIISKSEPIGTVDHSYVEGFVPEQGDIADHLIYKCSVCDASYDDFDVTVKEITLTKSNRSEYGYRGTADEHLTLTPPYKLGGVWYKITEIDDSAFEGCTNLKSITVPESVKRIGTAAFKDCSGVDTLTIPEGVKKIEARAFYNCTGLKKINYLAIELFDIYNLASAVFSNAGTSTDGIEILIGKNVSSIPSYLFSGWDDTKSNPLNVSDVVFEDGSVLESLGERCFAYCGITSVTLPDTVKFMGEDVFYLCTSLEGVQYDNAYYIGSASNPYFVLYEAVDDKITSCQINADTGFIHSSAFSNCYYLEDVSIPDGIIGVNDRAFYDCTSLKYTEYSNACYIGNENNPYLVLMKPKDRRITECTVHEDTKVIYYGAFYACLYLNSITIGENVTSIGRQAFYNCVALRNIVIPDSVINIGNAAFSGCVILSGVKLGTGLTDIAYSTFYNCASLEDIVIPDSVKYIGYRAFDECTSLKSVKLGNSVRYIGISAFYNCKSLTEIVIPASVQCIDDYVFNQNNAITAVYYEGTEDEWDSILISSSVYSSNKTVTVYYYSDKKPAASGNYWYYGKDGEIFTW